MFHSRDSPRLLVCDTGLYLEQNDIGFITVAICGGYISKYPGLLRIYATNWGVTGITNIKLNYSDVVTINWYSVYTVAPDWLKRYFHNPRQYTHERYVFMLSINLQFDQI